jgi:hypothetical protein
METGVGAAETADQLDTPLCGRVERCDANHRKLRTSCVVLQVSLAKDRTWAARTKSR